MNYIAPRLKTALIRSAIRKTARKKENDKISKNISFLIDLPKEEKKETQKLTTHKTFMKMHFVQRTKHQLWHDNNGKMIFELQGRDLLNDENKSQVETEKYKKSLKTINIIN